MSNFYLFHIYQIYKLNPKVDKSDFGNHELLFCFNPIITDKQKFNNQNKDYIDHVYKNSDSKLFINDGNDLSKFKNIKNIINNNIDEYEYNNEYNITNYELFMHQGQVVNQKV